MYKTGRAGPRQRQLVWFDRAGKEIGTLGERYTAESGVPAMSPNGRQGALARVLESGGSSDIWLLDTARGVFTRFTSDPLISNFPVWSPDGGRIVFQTNAKGFLDLYTKPANGNGPAEPLLTTTQNKSPSDWSSDGRWLLYRSFDEAMNWDLWALPMDGDRKPVPIVRTNFAERDAQFSPDGKWIAYQSNESGRDEIYVQPFPRGGSKERISTSGGTQVRWRRDGRELFYITLNDELMAVPIRYTSDGQSVEPGVPVLLFTTRLGGAVQRIGSGTELNRQQYMVSPDGERFLMNTTLEDAAASPITVILNWSAAARR